MNVNNKIRNKKNSILKLLSYIANFYHMVIPAFILAIIVSICSVVPVGIVNELTSLMSSNDSNINTTNTVSLEMENDKEDSNNFDILNITDSLSIRDILGKFVDTSTDLKYFTYIIVIGIIIAIIKFLSFYFSSFLIDYTGRKVIFYLRKDLFNTLIHLPIDYFDGNRRGKILSIINNDIIIIQDFVGQIIMTFIKELFTVIFILIILLSINPLLLGLIIIIAPFVILLINLMGKYLRNVEKSIREKFSDITNIIVEVLDNILIVKTFATENKENDKFIRENKKFLTKEKKFIKVKAINSPLMELIGFVAVITILGVGGYQVLTGGLLLSDIITFAVALTLISSPLQNISKGFMYIKQASASIDRIFEFMDNEVENIECENKKDIPNVKGNIVFKNISFSYDSNNKEGIDNNKVLDNINISIKEKTTIAFVGSSGSGKSTLIKLIPRLIKPQEGNIYIDGYDIWDYNLISLRKQIGLVTQDIMLFHGSIADNIRYGNIEANMNDIIESSKIANAYNFIMELPDEFDTQIGEKGIMLSGGQRQRISLARALIRKPAILILDEATSSLDTESEKAIQDAFLKINHKQTTIVIAHRLSTIMNSDKIYVIDNGRIVETGTHNELLDKAGIYKKLYNIQFK